MMNDVPVMYGPLITNELDSTKPKQTWYTASNLINTVKMKEDLLELAKQLDGNLEDCEL